MAAEGGQYRLSPLAERDLEDIWRYSARTWSVEQADRYVNGIAMAIKQLASGTKTGSRVDVREGYFRYAVGSHCVFYRHSGAGLDAIRVLHQRMDVDRHL
jgi:toxin ParE1/3/4